MAEAPILSIVIPCHRSDEHYVLALMAQLRPLVSDETLQTEVIIVFNGYGTEPLRIELPEHIRAVGYAHGMLIGRCRNIGTVLAGGEYLLFLDSDVYLPTESVTRIPDAIRRMSEGGYKAALARRATGVSTSFARLDSQEDIRAYRHYIRGEAVTTLEGPFLLIHAGTFRELGGFEERSVCAEDKDLAARLQLAGHEILFVSDVSFYHDNPGSLRAIIRRKLFHARCNALIYERYPEYYHRSLRQWTRIVLSKLDRAYGLSGWIYSLVVLLYVVAFYLARLHLRLGNLALINFRSAFHGTESIGCDQPEWVVHSVGESGQEPGSHSAQLTSRGIL